MAIGNHPRNASRLVGLAAAIALLLVLAPAAYSTWSIIIVDSATGEVGVGMATCIAGFDLKPLGVVKVGVGGGTTQAFSPPGSYRELMFQELLKGTPPDVIVELMQDISFGDESRQFGIADHTHRSTTFTGKNCAPWAGGRAGRVGSIAYAVQGNIMVGEPVIANAEFAIVTAKGHVADKLMAAMEAARAAGGDARCTQLGKSSHVAFMVVARLGDIDAPCNSGDDCTSGTYFLDFNVANTKGTDPDPVLTLEQMFAAWRTAAIGRPDQLESATAIQPQLTPADGVTKAHLLIALADWQGLPVGHGGATVIVTHDPSSAQSSTIGPVTDRGDGTYAVELTAGTITGEDVFQVMVDDGVSPVLLHPNPSFHVGPPLRLRADRTEISSSAGDAVTFKLRASTPFAGRQYLLLLSASGTDPGFDLDQLHVPLNLDQVLLGSWVFRNSPVLKNSEGQLNGDVRAEATFDPRPDDLRLLVGSTLSFGYISENPEDFASEVVSIHVNP